jgi:hypothetical protein
MFKKPDSKPANPLNERLQRIAGKPALDDTAYQGAQPKKTARSFRDATFKQATIRLQGGERMDVVVKNLSATGARIEFFRKVTLTDQVLISEPSTRLKRLAKVVWQKEGSAGLHFLPDPP